MITRRNVVDTARGYLGTPFAHQGRVKGLACDCVGLPLMVAGELGLKDVNGEPFTGERYNVYTSQPLGNYVHDLTRSVVTPKPLRDMKPGDVVSIRFGTAITHLAIVSDYEGGLGLIHAYTGGAGKVVEHGIDAKWKARIVGCFQIPGVIE